MEEQEYPELTYCVYVDSCCVLGKEDGVASPEDAKKKAVEWFISLLQKGEAELVVEVEG